MSERRVVMVTGASGRLGRALATACLAAGDAVIVVDRSRERLSAGYDEGERCRFAVADLLDAAAVRAAVDDAVSRTGRLDALFNTAGGFSMGPPVHETPDDDWARLHDLNVRTLRHACAAAVPHLLRAGGGAVVNVGAFSALRGAAGMGAYIASKAEVIRITESMSAELRDRGVRVNAVLPTVLDTPENRAAMPGADPARWVPLEALVDVMRFLASDAARAVHGAALPVTGLS